MVDLTSAIELFGVAWGITEGSILYFVLRLRQNSRRLETEFIPNQIAQVTERLENIDWGKAGATVYEHLNLAMQGMRGAVEKEANKEAGAESLKQLAALDWGNPLANNIWSMFVMTQGPRVLPKLGALVRRIPYIGKYAGDIFEDRELALPDHTGTYTLSQ